MEQIDITKLFDFGMSGVMLFMLAKLWSRHNALEDRLFGYLEGAKRDRHALKAEVAALKLKTDKIEEQTAKASEVKE